MTTPWTYAGPTASLAAADSTVTVVEGQTFCLSGRTGDMVPDFPHGLFVLDTRVLSQWELRVNGHRLEPLTVTVPDPFAATFVGRAQPGAGRADGDLVVFRRRAIGNGMRERIVVRNFGLDPSPVVVELFCDVDFADLFEVKENRVRPRSRDTPEAGRRTLRFRHVMNGLAKEVTLSLSDGAIVEPGLATWRSTMEPRQEWEVCVDVSVRLGGTDIPSRFGCDRDDDERLLPAQRLDDWRQSLPTVETDHPSLAATVRRSGEDLGALRIFDPDHPELPILAAGAPWFMSVFGRDSLLTAWMSLLVDPDLAHGVLETLARFQGRRVDPVTEEEPGRILHEMRFGAAASLSLGSGHIYYGSIDATPLFVMLLGEMRRWGLADDVVERLLPHADAALDWIERYGDRDGDGYVEYQRATPQGLFNQGWKDSWDGIRFADGRLPQPPIALCEVQGYVYAAYTARAHFAQEAGDEGTCERYRTKALELKQAFNRDFWLDDRGWFALALDADKNPIDALASNMGHCLWSGIIDDEKARAVADQLLGPELFSGWGIRTLATTMAAYNPVSYHNGSVWPHDNALCAAGLMRYGFIGHANRVVDALLDVAAINAGRLPELFAGFDRTEIEVPATYPTSCVPQAWAAAAPLLLLRTMLRFDPWASNGQLSVAPALPPTMQRLVVRRITVAGRRISVAVEDDTCEIQGADGLEIIRGAHSPLPTIDE